MSIEGKTRDGTGRFPQQAKISMRRARGGPGGGKARPEGTGATLADCLGEPWARC